MFACQHTSRNLSTQCLRIEYRVWFIYIMDSTKLRFPLKQRSCSAALIKRSHLHTLLCICSMYIILYTRLCILSYDQTVESLAVCILLAFVYQRLFEHISLSSLMMNIMSPSSGRKRIKNILSFISTIIFMLNFQSWFVLSETNIERIGDAKETPLQQSSIIRWD